jgi:hypothetical protein
MTAALKPLARKFVERFAAAAVAGSLVLFSTALASAQPAGQASRLQFEGPELIVSPFESGLARADANHIIGLLLPEAPAPSAKVVVYVATGYSVDLTLPAGTVLGPAIALVRDLTNFLILSGNLVVDSPSRYVDDSAAVACAGSAPHAAVWSVQFREVLTGTVVPVVFFVDRTEGADAALGAYKIQFCLPPPGVGAAGGGVLPQPITVLLFDDDRGLTNPSAKAVYTWRAFITPFATGNRAANPAATVEVRSLVPLPQVLSLKGRYDRKAKSAVLSGTLTGAGTKLKGLDVEIRRSAKAALSSFKTTGHVKTRTNGAFTLRRPASKTLYYLATVDDYVTRPRCDSGPSTAPAGCIAENLSVETSSRAIKVKVPRKR